MQLETTEIDCLVIGGGVAGLACGRALSELYNDTFLLEENSMIAQETSSRNSEVIHAGIYYPAESLKSDLCIKGKHLLYEYLDTRGISYNKCGKYIISTSDNETERLNEIYENSRHCGVADLEFKNGIKDSDFLNYKEVLFSPSTGIFDSHGYLESIKRDFESNGGTVLLKNKTISVGFHKNKCCP